MDIITLPAPPALVEQVVWPVFVARCIGKRGTVALPQPPAGACLLAALDRGTASWYGGGAPRILQPDTAVLLFPTDQIRTQEGCRLDCIALSGALAAAMLEETYQVGGSLFPNSGTAVRAAAAALRHPTSSGTPDPLAASATAYQLLMQLYRQSCTAEGQQPYPPLVRDAIGILRKDYAYLYGVEELADRLRVTKSHLIRVFSAAVGIPPGQYLTRVRIEAAKLLLRSQDATLELVAAATGFSSAGYFGKVFRRETGVTPARYAAAARRGVPLPDDLYL